MTKVIRIKRVDDTFSFETDSVLFLVDAKTKKLDGKVIYQKVYQDVVRGEKASVTIDQSGLSAEDKKVFGNYIVDLFGKLDEAINKQLVAPLDGQTAS
jgi:hypothetical protein